VVDYGALLKELKNTPDFAAPPDYDAADALAKHRLAEPAADPHKAASFLRRRAFIEARLLEKVVARPFELLVLAGFMRTLSPYFIDRVNIDKTRPRIINIHPSLLPAFAGLDGYGDTFRYGCKVGGCTVHFVDYGADTGPIIAQKTFAIEAQDTLESVRAKGLELEWEIYPYCIQLFAQGRLRLEPCSLGPQGTCHRRRVVRILDPV
jgi:phosphoribosylglycinamide formyltransferase-1